ncbi:MULTISPECIES: thiamine pyrophosphate-dependent enzyme [Pseudidiomarina]|uniref:3-methyl-2-oxobutanoate dehydrogenase (2-methylpropanoyl-transferring) n=2 Tax=Pseudidiomarina TaxID=2800384 RepID=A0A368UMW2_9GAMM|nr:MULTISPECIES: thiamine pyrophosphate-dependent enzyme [Pseudidiomarina]PWW10465.1 branched-chain alpha-keto acid dehydrogenase E1 component [Pseudidiomarina maritima]RBP88105.1 branched-chain alpha-keto acid dehydrogenase E1 component [Pseudidiomarina tainanensis]RCW30116.1 branched-chain alpha-keto acid dehydrogenase E1 component [Pseudidiomarina tainanensis]
MSTSETMPRAAMHPWLSELLQRIEQGHLPQAHAAGGVLSDAELYDLFDSQLSSRLLDLQSRLMQAAGQSFYTIGSAGHEGNAAVAKALRVTDPAFLHYRSGAFFIQRAKQAPGSTPLYDMLLSFAAAADEPIAGGRHKVLGSLHLNVPPQTSTIASHVPKAMGTAFALGLSKRLAHQGTWPHDAIAVCSFGDASANHSTALGAINSASWAAYQQIPMPLLLVCEDNGLGISTHTPRGWIQQQLSQRPALKYFSADGSNLAETYLVAQAAADYVRNKRKPAILHLRTVRLFGHAGADAEVAYRSKQEIALDQERDPLLHSCAAILSRGLLDPHQLGAFIQTQQQRIARIAVQVSQRPKLNSAAEVMASIVPPARPQALPKPAPAEQRQALFQWDKHNVGKPQHLAKQINWALHDLMAQYSNIVMCGEDIAKKGGVYHVTQHLMEAFGPNRVLNTVLDEQSILGLAIGMAQQGFIAMPEIQFLAYVHNAEDQIRGEAATLSFFSSGQYTNPMVIRIAGLAYQRGFGGHFHNDNSFAVFRDIPGIILLCPSHGRDGALLMRQAVQLAAREQRVVIMLEPIALYMTRDLHQVGDNGWLSDYPDPQHPVPELGEPAVFGDGLELAIISYGNGYYLSRQAEAKLAAAGHSVRVLDLRCLVPLHVDKIIAALDGCKKVLIVDECRSRGSLSEELFTALHEHLPGSFHIKRLNAADSFIPLGAAAYTVLPSCTDIVTQALAMLEQHHD